MDAPPERHPDDPAAVAARLLDLAARMPHLVGVTDEAGRLVWINEAGRRFIGAEPDAPLTTADVFDERVFDRYYARIRPVLVRDGVWTGELPVRRSDGSERVVDAVLVADVSEAGEVRSLACLAVDVSEQHEREAALSHRASHDPLTGLPNRALLRDRLAMAVSVAHRAGSPVAVLAIDLDGFKEVNDRYGHAVGDQLLQQVTARIQAAVRPSDTVARPGGDEFVVVVHPPEEVTAATSVAERIRDQIGMVEYAVGPHQLRITASIGLTMSKAGAVPSPEALLHAADRGMYRAKRSGGNCVRLAGSAASGIVDPLDGVGDELARALAEGRIVAAFDPVVDLEHHELCAVQALARWDHPERGMLAARDFAEDATVTGYSDLVWWAATRNAVRLAGHVGLHVPLHVNLATSQLRDPELVERLVALRALAPHVGLHLKVDAHSLLELATSSSDVLAALSGLGFELVLSGHGDHTLPTPILDALPVSAIQLSHGVVDDVRRHPRAVALATTVAGALDRPCIARPTTDEALPLLAVLGVTAICGRSAGGEWDAERLAAEVRGATRPRP